MTAAAMTYDSLVADIQNYCERDDTTFLAQIDRFIMMAETRLAKEAKGLGLVRYVTATMTPGNGQIAKPSRWRETKAFSFIDGTGRIQHLKLRSIEYCQTYWPTPATQGSPRFYADYGFEHFLVVATPDSAYDFTLAYYERPEPLSSATQTNWTTQNAPDALLYACLLEAQPFLKNTERIAEFQGLYDRALSMLRGEDQERKTDASAKDDK